MIGTYIQLISFSSILYPLLFLIILHEYSSFFGHDHIFYAHQTVTFLLLLLHNCNYFHTLSQDSSMCHSNISNEPPEAHRMKRKHLQ
jgi:hypothetical protein